MNKLAQIEDIEQQIYLAYSEGDYQLASNLERELKKYRQSSVDMRDKRSEPYSLEGHVFIDDE